MNQLKIASKMCVYNLKLEYLMELSSLNSRMIIALCYTDLVSLALQVVVPLILFHFSNFTY